MIKETTEQLILLLRNKAEENTVMSQGDITEIKTLPAIVLTGPRLQEVRSLRTQAKITEKDMELLTYAKETAPRWYNMRFEVSVSSQTFRGLADRIELLSKLAQSDPLLTVEQEETGRSRQYYWDWETFPSNPGTPNISGVYEAAGEIIIYDVEIYSGIATEGPLITRIEIESGVQPRDGDATTVDSVEIIEAEDAEGEPEA